MKQLLVKLGISLLVFLLRNAEVRAALRELAASTESKLDDAALQVFLAAADPVADALEGK